MPASAIVSGESVMWQEIVTPREPLAELVREHSAALAIVRAQALYPWVEPDRVGAKMRSARQFHSAGKHRLAAEIVRDFEEYAERIRPGDYRPRKTVSPWMYRSAAAVASGAVLFGGWVIR